jgi:hypothetical protein
LVLLIDEIEFGSEKTPSYFRKPKYSYSLKPQTKWFDLRDEKKQIYDDNTPYQKAF